MFSVTVIYKLDNFPIHFRQACKERADGILFLFSFTDKGSFEDIPQQMSRVLDANDNMSKFVLGTKYP